MDVLKLTPSNPQQPPDTAATSAEGNDDATQGPLTFKALLTQLKMLKLGHADPAMAGKPADIPAEDISAQDEPPVALGAELMLTTAGAALPPAFAIGPGAATQAQDGTDVMESRLATTPDALLFKQDPRAALKDALVAGKEIQAADFAARGESLPHPAEVSGSRAVVASTEAQPGLHVPAASQQARGAPSAADFAARGEYSPHAADANRFRSSLNEAQPALQATAELQQAPGIAPAAISAPPAAPSATAQISTLVASAAWGNDLGQHIVWMVGNKQQVAELHLNPPNLGPLDIRLTVDDKQTTAVFTSPHGAVRDAIVAELPRLREVLAESGITLGNASVTADNARDGSAFAQPSQRGLSNAARETVDLLETDSSAVATRHLGMVDLFA